MTATTKTSETTPPMITKPTEFILDLLQYNLVPLHSDNIALEYYGVRIPGVGSFAPFAYSFNHQEDRDGFIEAISPYKKR